MPIVIGGHTATAYPKPFLAPEVSAVVLDDGERALPSVCDALDRGAPLTAVPGLALPDGDGGVLRTAGETGTLALVEYDLAASVEPFLELRTERTEATGSRRGSLPPFPSAFPNAA